jgi:hypothetical protein
MFCAATFESAAQEGISPQRNMVAWREESDETRLTTGTGCVGAMLYRGSQSSSSKSVSICSARISFRRESL